jgi:CheY-like chemotaxis protein
MAMKKIVTGLGIERATPHDLRRTCLTTITRLGFGRDAMDRIANHKTCTVTDVYDRHGFADEVHDALITLGVEVIVQALGHVLANDFAVILLDVEMPGMDGFEAAALIRTRKRSAYTPVIFVTAHADELHALRGYASGAVDYILTPVVPDILRTKVRVFVDLFRLNRQVKEQAEWQLAQARGEQARLASVLENAADFVGQTDASGRVLHVNGAGRRMIGRTDREPMYDFKYRRPETLVPRRLVFEVAERVTHDGTALVPFDRESAVSAARRIREQGADSVAVCFLHAYAFPQHENTVGEFLRKHLPNDVDRSTRHAAVAIGMFD